VTTEQRFTLSKQKSLKSQKLIDALFKEGHSISDFPIRLVYLPIDFEGNEPFLVGFSVPKRKFKRAVDRNRIKRLLRESFRLQQHDLKLPQKTIMMWLYTGKDLPDYNTIFEAMKKIISQFNQNGTT
jgi:ribonuclease P protein component